jgi:hypothetical protein
LNQIPYTALGAERAHVIINNFIPSRNNFIGENKRSLHLHQNEICDTSKELFTEVVRICFPGEEFTYQVHSAGRDRRNPTHTQDYSGAVAYVSTLPTRTIRFYTKLWMRNPNFRDAFLVGGRSQSNSKPISRLR